MHYLIFFLISGFILACFAVFKLGQYAKHIFSKLNTLKNKAKLSETKDELDIVWNELNILNKECCWHKTFEPDVVEIKTILETKYNLLKNDKETSQQFKTLLQNIYQEIDDECISETNTVTMNTISIVFAKYGANLNN